MANQLSYKRKIYSKFKCKLAGTLFDTSAVMQHYIIKSAIYYILYIILNTFLFKKTREISGFQNGCLGLGRSPNKSTEVLWTLRARALIDAAIWSVSEGLCKKILTNDITYTEIMIIRNRTLLELLCRKRIFLTIPVLVLHFL